MGKVIVIDWGYLTFSGIFAYKMNKQVPLGYTILSMLLGNLFKVGVNEQDKVFIAVDYGHSWRKQYDNNYKAGRKAQREKQTDINWEQCFSEVNRLLDKLDAALPFHILKVQGFEADDFMAYATKYYSDREVIIISADSDLEQLLARPNVKIFSPKSKKWKKDIDPYQLLAKKIRKEAADGLSSEILTEADYEKRRLIVDLLNLPDFVESTVKNIFDNLESKPEDIGAIPYRTLQSRYMKLYTDKSKIISFNKKTRKRKCTKSETK